MCNDRRLDTLTVIAGMPLISKTVSGIRGNCMITATRITLMAVNDELARLGHAERLAKADNYFLFPSL